MTCKKIGKHNDRFIFIEEVENLRHIETNYSSESAILLWLGNEDWKKEEFIDVVEKMVKKEVIAICVTGKRVDEQFDLLISTQGPISTKKHTMTYMFDEKNIENVLENLFWVVITDGERWDSWKNYLIICVADQIISDKIKKLIKEKWDNNAQEVLK
ncbi:MAG: hypothetical protein NT166_09140 [Candidatus Aminicenantes bacterium]|nr:hypothetical protein [Candidatus Aminicenantes bacterium]